MKKNIGIIVILSVLIASCSSRVKVNGEISNCVDQNMYFEQVLSDTFIVVDSAIIENGIFTLEAKSIEPSILRIRFSQGKYILVSYGGNRENISITGDFESMDSLKFKGSESTSELQKLLGRMRTEARDQLTYNAIRQNLAQGKNKDSIEASVLQKQELSKNMYYRDIKDFIIKSAFIPNKLLALGLLNYQKDRDFIKDQLQASLTKYPESKQLKEYISRFESRTHVSISNAKFKAIEIELPDPNGKVIKLSDFKGKYVLVDFWASWCMPCRRLNPDLVSLYNLYKNQNFTILGVSLDSDKEDWLKAIKDDNLGWTHISDLKEWQNKAARDYNIESIPSNVLIDTAGNIIGKNLEVDELDMKLSEFFKTK